MYSDNFAELAKELQETIPEASRNYLLSRLSDGRSRLVCETVRGGGVHFYLARYPQLRFTVEDLKGIDSIEKEDAFANKDKVNLTDKELVEDAKAEGLKPGDNELDQMIDERAANKEVVMDELKESPDMLVGTGLTGVISDGPVVDGHRFASDGDPDMVKAVKEAYPNGPTEEERKTATPMVKTTPVIMPNKYSQKYTLTKKPKKESGVADIIVLSIIVIVYLAIIVNLILRLK